MADKPRVIKDYDKLPIEVIEQVKLHYPYGYQKHLISFKNPQGQYVSALPFETEDRYYLIRMTKAEAQEIIRDDDDFDADGHLKEDVREEYEDTYGEDVEPDSSIISLEEMDDEI